MEMTAVVERKTCKENSFQPHQTNTIQIPTDPKWFLNKQTNKPRFYIYIPNFFTKLIALSRLHLDYINTEGFAGKKQLY